MATLAKGVMRPRSAMLGQFDTFYTCELLVHNRGMDDLGIVRDITALTPRTRFRQDWRAALAGAYMADLTSRVLQPREQADETYRLLSSGLDALESTGWKPPIIFRYELRLLDILGLAPKLRRCACCNKRFAPPDAAWFSARHGGMRGSCCPARSGMEQNVEPDVRAVLDWWDRSEGWKAACSARCTPGQMRAAHGLLGDFLAYHTEQPEAPRRATFDFVGF